MKKIKKSKACPPAYPQPGAPTYPEAAACLYPANPAGRHAPTTSIGSHVGIIRNDAV